MMTWHSKDTQTVHETIKFHDCHAFRFLRMLKFSTPANELWDTAIRKNISRWNTLTLKVVRAVVFCVLWLGNVLRMKTFCILPASELPKLVRSRGVWHFYLDMPRPSGATHHGRNPTFSDFPNSSRACIFFLLSLSLSLFYSFSDSSHLCCSSLHIRKFDPQTSFEYVVVFWST